MTDGNLIVAVLASGTFVAAAEETLRYIFGRGRTKVDTAKAVEGMALDLLKPLRDELQITRVEAGEIRISLKTAQEQAHRLQANLEAVIAWSLAARAILDSNHLDYPPVPDPLNRPRGRR